MGRGEIRGQTQHFVLSISEHNTILYVPLVIILLLLDHQAWWP
jgi:hypothetical protein